MWTIACSTCIGCVAHMCPYGYKASPHVPPEGRSDLDSAPQQFSFWESTGIALGFELQAPDHEIHQVIPMVKDHIPH